MKRIFLFAALLLSIASTAQIKISQLPAAGALSGSELVNVVQSGVSKKATVQQIIDMIPGGGSYTAGYAINITSGVIKLDTLYAVSKPFLQAYVAGQISAIPAATWPVSGTPSTFPPAAHTQALSTLLQSGATTGQAAIWNGSAWAPGNVAGSSEFPTFTAPSGFGVTGSGTNSIALTSPGTTSEYYQGNGTRDSKLNFPVSTAQATAIATAQANASARANHTGTQPQSSVLGLPDSITALRAAIPTATAVEPVTASRIMNLDPASLGLVAGNEVSTANAGPITFMQSNSSLRPIYETTIFPQGGITFSADAMESPSYTTGNTVSTAMRNGSWSWTVAIQLSSTGVTGGNGFMQTVMGVKNSAGGTAACWLGHQWVSTNILAGQTWATFTNYNNSYYGSMWDGFKYIMTYTFSRTSSTTGTESVYINGSKVGSNTLSGANWEDGTKLMLGSTQDLETYFGYFTLGRMEIHNKALNQTEVDSLHDFLGDKYGITTRGDKDKAVNIVFLGNSIAAGATSTAPHTTGFVPLAMNTVEVLDAKRYQWWNLSMGGREWNHFNPGGLFYTVLQNMYQPGIRNVLYVMEDINEQQKHTGSPGAGDAATVQAAAHAVYLSVKALGYTVIAATSTYSGAVNASSFINLNRMRRADSVYDYLHDIDMSTLIGTGNPSTATPPSGTYYSDPTHFNDLGNLTYAADFVPLLHDVINGKAATPRLTYYGSQKIYRDRAAAVAGGVRSGQTYITEDGVLRVMIGRGQYVNNLPKYTAAEATALTVTGGETIEVTTTNGTFSAVGAWHYNGTVWTQL